MSNVTMGSCPLGFAVEPSDIILNRSFCIAGCCVLCPYQGTTLTCASLTFRNDVPFIHPPLSSNRCPRIRISPSHLLHPLVIYPLPEKVTSQHAKDLPRHFTAHNHISSLVHDVPRPLCYILRKRTCPRDVPQFALW